MCMDMSKDELNSILNPFRDQFRNYDTQLNKIDAKLDKMFTLIEETKVQNHKIEKDVLQLKTAHDFVCANQERSMSELRQKLAQQELKTDGLQVAVNEIRTNVVTKEDIEKKAESQQRQTSSWFQIAVYITTICTWVGGIVYAVAKFISTFNVSHIKP